MHRIKIRQHARPKTFQEVLFGTEVAFFKGNEDPVARKIMSPNTVSTHVENRRLLAAATATITLKEWESDHLHACELCQGVFHIFLVQTTKVVPILPETIDPAA